MPAEDAECPVSHHGLGVVEETPLCHYRHLTRGCIDSWNLEVEQERAAC